MSDDQTKKPSRQRTTFKPVGQRLPPQPPAAPPRLRVLSPDEQPRYAGLSRDERGVVSGSQGIVVVHGWRRMASLLAALSHLLDLAVGVTLERLVDGPEVLVLNPPAGVAPAQLYDTVLAALAAAQLTAGRSRLYCGDGRLFVPYLDPAAPHGYDIEGTPPATGRLLLHAEGTIDLPAPGATQFPAALLAVPLEPAGVTPATTLTLLTERRLVALVAGYVQRHELAYALRFLTWHQGDQHREVALFDIVTADALRPVPGFVADFLARLPRSILLYDMLDQADMEQEPSRRVLLARGWRTPLYLPHIQDLLPPHALLLLCDRHWGSALIESPPPRSTMQQLSKLQLPELARTTRGRLPDTQLDLRLELRRIGPAHGPIHALLLDDAAIERLRRLLRRLPAPFFANARIALGDGLALIVAAGDSELQRLPLGLALCRAEPPELLLPQGMRLLPALPQDLLVPNLGLQPDELTVLTPNGRVDVPEAALQPLSSLLALDLPTLGQRIELRPQQMPVLDLSDLREIPPPEAPPARPAEPVQSEQEQRSLLERLLGNKPAADQSAGSFRSQVRRQAAELERQQQYELAGAFYSFLGDEQRAAACYRQIAEKKA